MDEEFISDLYSFLITNEADYQNNQVPYEEFKQGLQDGAFSEELYNYLVTQDPSYAQDVSLEEFQRNVTGLTVAREEELLKKKEDTESSLDPSSSEPPTGEDYYKFMSTSDEDDIGIQEGGGITDLPTRLEVAQEIMVAPSSKGTLKPARKIGIDFLIQDYPLTFENLKSEEQKLLASEIPKEDLQNYERLEQQIQSINIPDVQFPHATKEYKELSRLRSLKSKIEQEYPVLTSWYDETPLSLNAEQKKYIGDLNKYKSEKDKDFLATDIKQREDAIRQNFLEGGSVDEFGEAVEGGTDVYEENIEKFINFDLIDGKGISSFIPGFDTTEEDAVSTMRSVFGDLGFKFEETGAGDYMIVTAPNGASKKIVLDQYGSDGDIEQMNILKDFMRKNKPKIQKDAKLRRYESEEQVKQDSDYLNFLADNYGKQKLDVEKANDEYYKLLASYNNMSDGERNSETGRALQANLIERKSSIAKQQRTLDYDAKALMKRGSEIDVAAGKYASLQKDLGTTFAGKVLNIFTKGATKGSNIIASGTTGTAMDIMSVLTDAGVLDGGPEHALAISKESKEALNNAILKRYGRTYEELLNDDSIGEEKLQEIQDFYNSKKRNYARFEQKKQIQGDIRRGFDKVGFGTQEAYEDLKENSEFWKVAYSVGESLPSMIYSMSGPMGFFQSTQFAKDMFDEEIQNAENGREIDTREVAIYNSLLGVPIAALDKLGFGWAVKGTGGKLLAQAIAKTAYKDVAKTGAKLTAKSWQKSVMKTIENKVAKFLVGSAGAGMSEFVTGGLQGFVEYTGKPLINYFKDEKVYDTPELNSSKYWKGVWENAYYEMLGGLFMGVPIGVAQSMSKQDFSKMDNDSWELFKQMRNDPNLLKLSDSKFLEEIALGNSTPMMALKIKNQFKEASNLLDQIPNADAYTTEQQKDIMGLLLRRHELQNRVKGKDKALSSKDNAEITEIEQKLAEFADTAGDVNYTMNKTDDRFKNLKEDDKVEVVVESLEDVPNNQYGLPMEGTKKRKTGTFEEVEVGENVNGLPIGKNKKKVSGTYYTYTLTGKQINNAIQEQSTNEMDANQSAPNVQEMEGGASETGPEVTAQQEGQQVSEEQQVQKEKLNNLGFTDEVIEMMTPEDIEVAQTYTEPSQATEMVERYQQDVEAAKALAAEDTTAEGVETVGVAGEVTEQNKGKIKYNSIQAKIIRQGQKAVQSVKKIMPNLRIITYATDEEYVAAVPGSKIGERGEISDDGNTIRINLAAADETTVGHEIFHAIITSKFNINSKKIATAVNNDLIKKLLKILPKDKYRMNVVDKITKERKQISLHEYLEEYVKEYKDTETHSEEKLAQIFGFLGANYSTLTYQEQSIITKFFNKLRTLFGKEAKGIEFSKDEARVADLLNTLAYKVKVGEEIQEGDLELFDEVAEEVGGQPTETTTEEAPAEEVVEEEVVEETPAEEVVEEEVVEEAPTEEAPEAEVVEEEVVEETPAEEVNKKAEEVLNETKKFIESSKKRKLGLKTIIQNGSFYDFDLRDEINNQLKKLRELAKEVDEKYYADITRAQIELNKVYVKMHQDYLKRLQSPAGTIDDAITRGIINPFEKITRQKQLTANKSDHVFYAKQEIRYGKEEIERLNNLIEVSEEASAEEVNKKIEELLNETKELIESSKKRKRPLVERVMGTRFDFDFNSELRNQINKLQYVGGLSKFGLDNYVELREWFVDNKLDKKDYIKFLRAFKELYKAQLKLREDELKKLDKLGAKFEDVITRGIANPILRTGADTRAEEIAETKELMSDIQDDIKNIDEVLDYEASIGETFEGVVEAAPTSRKQVAAKEVVAPMKVNEEFSKMTPAQKRKQLGGRYGIMSLELRKNLLFAEEEYKRRDEYDRLSKSRKLKDMDLFAKKYQGNPPMTEKQIFINTGWYRGIDGEYRYEIPDGKLVKGTYQEFTREAKNPAIREARLDEIYIAPEVYKTYPFIKDIMVQFVPMLETNDKGEVVDDTQTRGSWNNGTKIIKINTNSEDFAKSTSAQQKTRILSTIVHEVQHAIQHFEGFALGSSPVESKAGLGKRVKEKFGEGKEDLTKEEIFASEAQKGLRKRYEMFRINKEFMSHYITVVNALEQAGDIANLTKLLKSKNKGKDLLKIVRDQETNPNFNNVYKELKADAKYYYDEVANKKLTVTQNVLGKFLDNMLDFSALNEVQTAKEIDSIDKKLRKMLKVYEAFNMYSRTYGEIESRNVQERLKNKKELAYLKSEINKVERLGKKKGVKQEEQLERIEQLEEQLYRELPTVREDDQGLVEDVNKDIQGPYIIKQEATGKRSLTEENAKAKEKLEGMNRKQLPSPNASMEDVIAWGRSRGESDAVLRMFLKSRGYGTIKEIREAMAQTVQMAAMPADLANIEGGLEVAEKMYEDIMTKFYDATMETREVVAESKKRIAKAKQVMQNNPKEYGKEKDGVFTKPNGDKVTLDITKAKRGVKIITATQVLGAPRTSMESVFTKSKAQRRAILQQIIESNEDYQNQDEANKANIQRLLDRALNTRANPSVEQRMRDVKRIAKAAEQNEKKLQEVRNRLRALIRESIPRNLQDETTTKNLNAMIKSLAKVNSTNVLVETKNILEQIERINKKEINSLRKKTLKIIKQKSSTANKGKTTGVDGDTNMFMQEIKKIWLRMDELLKAENSGELLDEYLNKIQEELEDGKDVADIDTIIQKTIDGTPLKAREKRKLYTNFAYDMMYNYPSLDYEGMQILYEEIADLKAEGIAKFKSNREARVKRNAKLEAEAVEQLKLKYPYLVKENGDFMDEQEIQQERAKLFDKWKKTRSFKAVKDWSRIVLNKKKQKYSEWFRAWLATNQTLNNALDVQGVGKSFFTKNVYQRLRDMRDAFLNGDEAERLNMNEMLNTIPGIAEKVSRFKNPYAVLVDMLAQPNITVQDNVYTRDEALRIYALSKNEVQREKLRVGTDKKGRGTFITDEGIQEIIDQLQPELIEYADKMVDYLSNDYYNSVNDVYMQVNSAALPYVENYFPTKTTNPQSDRNKIQKQLEKGDVDFNQVFNAETAPALHERTNVSGRIPLKGYTFTAELSSHFEQMERFKAYAEGVKIIRDIVNMDSVNSVLDVTGLKEVYLRNLMTTINPNAFQSKGPESIFGKALNNFSSFVLGFKLWQIPKQATSFINAFEDYDSGLIKRDVDGLGLTKSAADMLMFMVDMSTTTASLAFELMPKSLRESLGIPDGPITQAYRVSPTFRNRIQEAAKGDLWGLESGSRIKYNETADSESIIPRKLRLLPGKIRKVGSYPTMIGDVLGVMGYMINYRRDIRNGMSQEEALRKFNRYEATQQTRSETEKNRLQLESNDYLRAFTMFGSTPFLQQNKIAQASSNIMQAISRRRMPRKQDMRSLVLNLGVANVAFIYMSNIFKYAFGDDEDKEKVMKHMKKVMLGFNSLAAVPFIGPVIEAMDNYYQEGKTWSQDLGVNPVMQAWNKFRQAYEGKPKYKDIPKMLINIIGINTDPFVALYNKTIGDGDFFEKDEDYYKLRGISKSYRPKGAEEGETEEDVRQDLLDMGIEESELDEYMKDMK